ncbi:unnamed protein product [Protopolystoma xenopodis]|uniref:COX assembly mitochondrial protein n=1 Tax=Protopolystoma xenopodis TaxID=117903 RepID=A0A448XH43_9PLAT|nr:unnamed protein product [Protopolystoma xenopodis]
MVSSYKGGPLGLGDPQSNFISELERSNVLSHYIREKLLTELCADEWKLWRKCIRKNSDKWFPSLRCRDLFEIVNSCQLRYVTNKDSFRKLEEEYLSKRSEYRTTGVPIKFLSGSEIKKMTENEAKCDVF